MAEQLDRLQKRDLALALPVGNDNLRGLDLVRIPQVDERLFTPVYQDNHGNAKHEHIYNNARIGLKMLQSAHLSVRHMNFGTFVDGDHVAEDLEYRAQTFEDDDDYNIVGLDSRLRSIINDYNTVREQKLQARAKRLGKAIAERSVYVVASHPEEMVNNPHPDFYAAATVGMTVLRDGNWMTIEPIVESLSGKKGLMPQDFYAIRGLYVPTSR